MAKRDPRTGELLTTNYSWTKPTVGSSVDAWGGYVNADLDAIDSVVHGIDARTASAPYVPQAGYVPAMNDSRIINGDMRVNQRGATSGTVAGYTVDHWQFNASQTGKGTWNQTAAAAGGALLSAAGFGYYLSFTSSSTYSLLASDDFNFIQPIEADLIADFAWGTSGAQPVTLSFWVNSTLTGVFGGCIRNLPVPSTRSYPFTYSIPVANSWTKIVVTIPGDTGGPWVLQGNASGAYLTFSLGMGSTYSGPANAWAAANYHAPSGAISVVSTNGAAFSITGVKLEIGSVATPFNRQSLAKSMADCQRYYSVGGLIFQGYAVAGTIVQSSTSFAVAMRTAPEITQLAISNSNAGSMVYSSNPGGSIAAGYTA